MELEKYDDLRMDIQNLLSCIQHHESSVDDVVICTLKTIRNICENESYGKDAFRDEGGLDYLLQFLSSTENTVFLKHCLSTLAFVVDGNVHNQMHMTKNNVLGILQAILRKTDFPTDVHKHALSLAAAIIFQNSAAQSLIADIELLSDLMMLSETGAPCKNSYTFKDTGDIWCMAITVLNFAVNNPRNEKNQDTCSSLFPTLLNILDSTCDPVILKSICSFLSVCISNNRTIQDRFADSDGLMTLRRSLGKYSDTVFHDMSLCNVIGKTSIGNIGSIVAVISAASEEHEKNSAFLGEIGILSTLVKLLSIDLLDVQVKVQITLCLGQCVACHANSAVYILNHSDFEPVLKCNFEMGNKELSASTKYLLDVLQNLEIGDDGNFNHFSEERFSSSESFIQPRNSMNAPMFADARPQTREKEPFLEKTRSKKSDTSLNERDKFKNMLSSLQHEITDCLDTISYGKRKRSDQTLENSLNRLNSFRKKISRNKQENLNILSPGDLFCSSALSSETDDSVCDDTQLSMNHDSKIDADQNFNLDDFVTLMDATEKLLGRSFRVNSLGEKAKHPKFSIFAAGLNSDSKNEASLVASENSVTKRTKSNNSLTDNNNHFNNSEKSCTSKLNRPVGNGIFKQPFNTFPKTFDQCSHRSRRSRTSIISSQMFRQNMPKSAPRQQRNSVQNESISKSTEQRDSCFHFKPVIPNLNIQSTFPDAEEDQITSSGLFTEALNGDENNEGENNEDEVHQNEVRREGVLIDSCATGDSLKNEMDARSKTKEILKTPSHSNNIVEVIVLSGQNCSKHGLISSCERMEIIPLRKHMVS